MDARSRLSTLRRAGFVASLALAAACSGEPRGDCRPSPEPGALGTICGVANPEDLEVVSSARLLLVSELVFPGRRGGGSISALSLDHAATGGAEVRRLWPIVDASGSSVSDDLVGDPACTAPVATFAPHGLTSRAIDDAVRVAVVVHGEREAIELFDLVDRGVAARLVWRGCVPLPAETSANDVALAPDGEIVISNFMPEPPMPPSFGAVVSMLGATLFGLHTGDVMTWNREAGWRHVPGSEAALPNGVAVSADGASIFFAETATGRVVRLPRAGASGEGGESVMVGGSPDNLSWSEDGKLWVATHTSSVRFAACAFGRAPCRSPWAVFAIDPQRLAATETFAHDGDRVGAIATAARSGSLSFFGAVYDDRIGVRRDP